jgi:hypothetical protein
MSDYGYDIFLSYSRRGGNAARWVQTHLVEVLTKCLEDELGRTPKVFLDTRMETGTKWPLELERGLRRSRMLLAVLSPLYFKSEWCLAEWESMALREHSVGMTSPEAPNGLIFPLVYSDGESFPESARERQSRSVKDWGYPYPQFASSLAYLDFHDEMKSVAAELGAQLEAVPAWREGWPIERPRPVGPALPARLPEL